MTKHLPAVDVICERCGKSFKEIPSRLKRGKGKFCSVLCYRGTPDEQFFSKVRKTRGCWLWTGSIVPRGYGHIRRKGRSDYAHRLSWRMHFGDIPKGMHVLHRCDNPSCVRPDHLFLGTAKDNAVDCISKGRKRNQFSDRRFSEK